MTGAGNTSLAAAPTPAPASGAGPGSGAAAGTAGGAVPGSPPPLRDIGLQRKMMLVSLATAAAAQLAALLARGSDDGLVARPTLVSDRATRQEQV